MVPLVNEDMDADCRTGVWMNGKSREIGHSVGETSACVDFMQYTSPFFTQQGARRTVCLNYKCPDNAVQFLQTRIPFGEESQRVDCLLPDTICPNYLPREMDVFGQEVNVRDWPVMQDVCKSAFLGRFRCPQYRSICGKKGVPTEPPQTHEKIQDEHENTTIAAGAAKSSLAAVTSIMTFLLGAFIRV